MILNERILRLMVLAEELHFGRAAERLHVSQPALSGSLKSLEGELGARLFRRTSRRVELTEAGNLLAAEARRLMAESDRTVALVRGCATEVIGPVRVGYPASMNLRWLGALIAEARNHGLPRAELEFVSCQAAGLREELAKGTIHAGFFMGNLRRRDLPGFEVLPLFRENFRAVLGAGHRLANCVAIQLEQLRDDPVVWLRCDADPLLHASFATVCSLQGFRPLVAQEVCTFAECLNFAREGVGITFLPDFMRPESGDEKAVFVKLSGPMQLEFSLAYRRDFGETTMARFAAFVESRLSAHPLSLHGSSRFIAVLNQSAKTND